MIPVNFPRFSIFKKLVSNSFLVGLQPVDRKAATPVEKEFLEISRRANFRNIPTHVKEVSKCRMFSRYFTKRRFHHRRSLKNFRKSQQETFADESVFSIITPDFTPDFNVIFHEILFFTTQKEMLRKIINCESLERS